MPVRPHVPDWPPPDRFSWKFVFGICINFVDHIHGWLKSDKSNNSGLLPPVIVGPYNSDTAFSARYAEEPLLVIEAGLCEVRTGTEETGEHRALRMIDCKRRMSIFKICCSSRDLRYLECVAQMRKYL
jgi:hypothetical protein